MKNEYVRKHKDKILELMSKYGTEYTDSDFELLMKNECRLIRTKDWKAFFIMSKFKKNDWSQWYITYTYWHHQIKKTQLKKMIRIIRMLIKSEKFNLKGVIAHVKKYT